MARAGTRKAQLRLRLYIAGTSPNSVRALANTKAICNQHFAASHELEIVDVITQPLIGLADGIIVTPTLIRLSPIPVRKVIGNLDDMTHVLTALMNN